MATPETELPIVEPEPIQPPTPPTESPAKSFIPPTQGEVITSELSGNTYTMGEKIGEGSFGQVYACVDVWNNELAVKILKPLKPYEQVKASAQAEIQKLVLLRHPYITYVFDAFEYRDTIYIITERCYRPLADFFSMEWFHGHLWIRAIARCLLQAVHFTHLNEFVHQDIHVGNVFAALAKDEMVPDNPGSLQFKLGDLGVAKVFGELDAANTRAQWMLPPEVIEPSEFGPLDHRIDIYHCGLLFLQLAYSRVLQFTPEEIRAGIPWEMARELAAPLNFALEKALRRHAQYRTASAMELWRDLNSPGVSEEAATEQAQLQDTTQPNPGTAAAPKPE